MPLLSLVLRIGFNRGTSFVISFAYPPAKALYIASHTSKMRAIEPSSLELQLLLNETSPEPVVDLKEAVCLVISPEDQALN